MIRIAAVFALLLALSVACVDSDEAGDEGSPPPNGGSATLVTGPPRPPSVPAGAQAVLSTARLGSIERAANATPTTVQTRTLLSASCEDEVVRFETSQETVFAALPCERFWTPDDAELFVSQEMAIVLEVTEERFRILIETLPGAQGEFTPSGIWVE